MKNSPNHPAISNECGQAISHIFSLQQCYVRKNVTKRIFTDVKV